MGLGTAYVPPHRLGLGDAPCAFEAGRRARRRDHCLRSCDGRAAGPGVGLCAALYFCLVILDAHAMAGRGAGRTTLLGVRWALVRSCAGLGFCAYRGDRPLLYTQWSICRSGVVGMLGIPTFGLCVVHILHTLSTYWTFDCHILVTSKPNFLPRVPPV